MAPSFFSLLPWSPDNRIMRIEPCFDKCRSQSSPEHHTAGTLDESALHSDGGRSSPPGGFTLLAAVFLTGVVGTEPKNDWINVLVMGVGTAIIGWVLKRPTAKFVLYVIAAFMFLIGIMMMTWLSIRSGAFWLFVGIVLAFFLLGRGMRK